MSNTSEPLRVPVSFAALDPYIEIPMVLPIEKEWRPGGIVHWGDRNRYPDYLFGLYQQVPTLHSVVDGTVDYVLGDGVDIIPLSPALEPNTVNRKGETAREQVKDVAGDLAIYGGFALQVIRDATGAPAEIHWVDMRYLRTDKECTQFWYSEKWGKGGSADAMRYPAFNPRLNWAALDEEGKREHASSILYVRGTRRQTYPIPRYGSAVKACEIERAIDDYHLNSLGNGFYGSLIVNFNNGIPEDKVKEEIERAFTEKFAGAANAGRIMFSWNRDMTTRTTLEVPKVEDFGERYDALASRSRQEIFTAFRANPNLFGIPTEDNGFANEQYEESFRLFNKTVITPMQETIREAYGKIFGNPEALTITPFSLPASTGGQDNG